MNDAPWQPQRIAQTRSRSVGDIRPAQPRPVSKPAPVRAPSHPEPAARPMLVLPPEKKQHKPLAYLQVAAIVIVAVVAGLLFQSLPLGEIAIVAYGIVALVRRVPARTTFIIALIALAMVPATMLASQPFLSENFATYAFLLLGFGIISVLREVRKSRKSDNAVNTT